jgi:hypothetical protein
LASSIAHVLGAQTETGLLCELSTSSPMAHMVALSELAEVGGLGLRV